MGAILNCLVMALALLGIVIQTTPENVPLVSDYHGLGYVTLLLAASLVYNLYRFAEGD